MRTRGGGGLVMPLFALNIHEVLIRPPLAAIKEVRQRRLLKSKKKKKRDYVGGRRGRWRWIGRRK